MDNSFFTPKTEVIAPVIPTSVIKPVPLEKTSSSRSLNMCMCSKNRRNLSVGVITESSLFGSSFCMKIHNLYGQSEHFTSTSSKESSGSFIHSRYETPKIFITATLIPLTSSLQNPEPGVLFEG